MAVEKLFMESLMKLNVKSLPLLLLTTALCLHSFANDMIESMCPPGVLFEVLALNHDLPTLKKPKYRSPTDLVPSPDKKRMYICEQSAKRIAVFSLETEKIEGYFRLPNEVTGCVVSSDGTMLYATCGSEIWPSGFVCVVDVASGKVSKRIRVGHYPRSPVLTPDGAKLFVCNLFSNDLSVIDVATRTVAPKTIKLVREPYCAAITPDGKTLVIGNALPNDRSTDSDFVSCMITLFDVEANRIDTSIRLTKRGHSVFGLTITPDGRYAFATHLISRTNLVLDNVERGSLHTNNIAMIDIKNRRFVNDVCLDLANAGTGNSWGIKCTENGEYMAIAHAGSNELSVIKLKDMIDTVNARTSRGIDLQREFTSLLDSRKRFRVVGKGPRAVTVIDSLVYTAGYFDDKAASMEMYSVTQTESDAKMTYSIGDPVPWTGERNGESTFYDASLCYQAWQSCSSCHPLTRSDALNHILGGGATVALKNSRSMLYSWWTPPTTWAGRRNSAHLSIAAGIELQLFRQAKDSLTLPLDSFLMSMKPVPSPILVKGRLSQAAERGKMLFEREKSQCSSCHVPPLFTDNKFHDAEIPDRYDANTQWVVPSLIEAWRTAPYNHLGSMTLREMVGLPAMSNALVNLSAQEIDDLVAYVLSL